MSKVLPTDIVNDVPPSLLGTIDDVPRTKIELVPLIDDCSDRDIIADDEFIEECQHQELLIDHVKMFDQTSSPTTRAVMFRINKEICKRYVPSRVYFEGDILVLLYYTNPSLTYRRFIEEDEYLYCCYFPLINRSYSYDMRARVMIDQVMCGTEMYCVFLFGSHEYDLLVSPKM